MSPTPRQTVMTFGTWGGWRPGAGRKPSKKRRRRVPHRARPRVTGREPLHVTLRVCGEVCSLRTKKKHRVIRAAFVAACNGKGFRIVDWSIQGDHLHLLVEARDLEHLSRGMQGFSVRVARGLNGLLGRRGAVFVGRYYVRALKTPREVRNAKAYILNNHRRHAKRSGPVISEKWVDKFSSWAWTDSWRDCPARWLKNARAGPEAVPSVAKPRTWLLRVGWRRHGLVSIAEVPCGSRR